MKDIYWEPFNKTVLNGETFDIRKFNEYYVYLNSRLLGYMFELVSGESSGVIAVQNWFMGKFFKREFSEIKQTTDTIVCPINNPLTSKFVPINEHLKYKYLISLDGGTASW